MMFFGVLAMTLVAGALATDCGCSGDDRAGVQKVWNDLWSGDYSIRVTVAKAVFADLFENHPETKSLFQRVNVANPDSPEFEAHCVRVINGLDTVINSLTSPRALQKIVKHLNQQHAERTGLKAEHFHLIGESFGRILPQAIHGFNPARWNRCFHRIANEIGKGLP